MPNFIDVINNFGSAALTIDSFIYQLIADKKKIVFCGDDTWIKLFPNQFIRQFENRDSLFVSDFYEVIMAINFFLVFRVIINFYVFICRVTKILHND